MATKRYADFQLTEREKSDIRGAFDVLDEAKVGYVGVEDVQTALMALGFECKLNEAAEVVQNAGIEDASKLSFEDFLAVMTSKMSAVYEQEELKTAFEQLDSEKKGFVTVENVREAAERLEEDVHDEEVLEMVEMVDQKGEGEVTQRDLVRLFKSANLE